ncbi:ABC transporter transmembrane domain-containing protein [Streptomyces himalayensis]|uniref:ABC transporter ATP-binding protein n=1 Tax=Streptomyces himalayensis subsp. himalayensis TaxID=2756131 RepID=A0A7W0DGK3_9ACTN|nr:ABC transporter ATP-binding protein [Streptomyces himalayensis]MBA2944652.1 ABC transporter ATP-binding protein [Streptomyces himalayensis subsp. himalayensis]
MIDAYEDPGTPDCRSGGRYLWWLVTSQRGRAAAGALLGSVWMVLMALTPYLLSRAIDDGLEPGDQTALAGWAAALLGLGAFNAWVSIMRHRTMTRLRMDANFRTVKVVVGQAVRLGAALPRQVRAGEVVTIGVSDVQTISQSLTIVGPGLGSAVAYVVVAVILLSISLPLAAVVLLGVPLTAALVSPLMARLQGAESRYRERQGRLTARIGDLAQGLRVLNGLGGKGLYAGNFRRDSRELQAEGYRVGAVTSWIQALGIGLPMLFLAVVTWLAARLAAQGAITVGELVSVYGYVAVLVMPVAFFIECGYQVSRALVAARRVVRFLALEPSELLEPAERLESAERLQPVERLQPAERLQPTTGSAGSGALDAPTCPSVLRDPESGVEVAPGRLTALVGARPAESAAVVDRLGRYTQSAATWGGVRLDEIALPQVRERILVADNEADLFAGTLRVLVCGRWGPDGKDDAAIARAVHAAVADDIVLGLSDGLDSAVDAGGRNLSGGQRQRVRLVRALLADPEVLLAIEPTSALDAHTEAAVAARLRAVRSGRTTVVTSTSPLVLDRADAVYYLVDGKVAAVGCHRELLSEEPGYRALVARDTDAEEAVR